MAERTIDETMISDRAGASAVYVSGEDNLRLTTFNSLAGVEIALEGRFAKFDGQIIPLVERQVPTSDRVATVTLHSLGEGYLSNVSLRAGVGAPKRGQTFCVVELVRGRLGAVQPLGCLVQGYVSSAQRRAWPGSPVEMSTEGPGVIRSILGTDPAAGVEISETVPAGARWRVLAIAALFTASGVAANRNPRLVLDDGANINFESDVAAAITATQSFLITGATGSQRLTGISAAHQWTFPEFIILEAGSRIRTITSALDVGDNWGAPQLLVEEWIAG